MEHEHFIIGYRYMREANFSQAMAHFCMKSKEWISENIPTTAYDETIFNYIKSTSYQMTIPCGETLYEVNGQWQQITKK